MKRMIALCLSLVSILFCSCEKTVPSVYESIMNVRERYSDSLGAVRLYYSEAEQGTDGYIDQGLIAALLGDGEYPAEMQGCREYAFLCASHVAICEVWAVECRTHTYAREVYALFEKRKRLLTAPDYESEEDAAAAAGAVLVRDGKYVYFAVNEKGSEITEYLMRGN